MYATAARKIKDTKNAPDASSDAQQQINRLIPKKFLQATPWDRLQHLSRYLKAITLRLDKIPCRPGPRRCPTDRTAPPGATLLAAGGGAQRGSG